MTGTFWWNLPSVNDYIQYDGNILVNKYGMMCSTNRQDWLMMQIHFHCFHFDTTHYVAWGYTLNMLKASMELLLLY